MSRQAQLICAWCGVVMVVLTLGGWLVCGILPIPPSANATAQQTVQFYAANPTRVRIGLAMASIGLCFIGPFVAVIAAQMLRMEGRTPILTLLQVISGAVTWVMLFVPMIILNVAAFRPERSPELTQMLTDLAWLLFLTPIGPFVVQNIAIGSAVLGDRGAAPVLPRWTGYLNLWVGLLFCPAALAYFFKSGPLAWHGVFVFWLGTVAYGVWALAMWYVLRKAVLEQSPEPALGLR